MNPETRLALTGWMRHFGLFMLVYLILLAVAYRESTSQEGLTRTVLVLAPILPGLALIWQTIRSYRRCDEFIGLRVLEAAALAAAIVAAFTLVYFFLELLGMPRLSTAWICDLIWAVFVVQMLRLIADGK
jgi:hypothetical protein